MEIHYSATTGTILKPCQKQGFFMKMCYNMMSYYNKHRGERKW